MRVFNRNKTIRELKTRHKNYQAIKALYNFLRRPRFRIIHYYGSDLHKKCIERWAKNKNT